MRWGVFQICYVMLGAGPEVIVTDSYKRGWGVEVKSVKMSIM